MSFSQQQSNSLLPSFDFSDCEDKPSNLTGLNNQGATCYLNSMLQALFMLPELRREVFQWQCPLLSTITNIEQAKTLDLSRNIPYQLQKLFALLQETDRLSIPTTGLTKSFGWQEQVYQQSDVQELYTILLTALKENTLGSSLNETIQGLFWGEMTNYTECQTCYSSRLRRESFNNLHITVKGLSDLAQGFDKLLTPEIMSGHRNITINIERNER